nr:hypothetical protein PsAHV6-064 [Psittacid alphaherpesvirus 6]
MHRYKHSIGHILSVKPISILFEHIKFFYMAAIDCPREYSGSCTANAITVAKCRN